MDWYVSHKGEREGPFSFEQIRLLAEAGDLQSHDLIWRTGMPDWLPAKDVPGILTPPPIGNSDQLRSEHQGADSDAPPESHHGTMGVARSSTSASTAQTSASIPEQAGRSSTRNYFVRHWYGDLTLGVSYWVNGFLGNIGVYAAIFGLAALLRGSTNNYAFVVYWCSAYLVGFAIVIWQLTGIWRSADRHIAETKRSGWANAAKVAVAIGLLRFFGDFVSTGIPAIEESLRQGDWLTKNAKWEINLLRDGTEIELSGGLGHGIADDFQKILNAAPNVQLVHVNLELGGLVDEGDKLNKIIRNRKLSTYTSSQCVSACSIAFLGGVERYIKQGARLGFHAYKVPGVAESASDYSAEKQSLIASGVTPEFAQRVFLTKSDTMWYPELGELLRYKVVTSVVSGDEFGLSGFRRQGMVANLEEGLLQTKIFQAIRKKEPELFQTILGNFREGIQSGKSMDELRPLISPHVRGLRDKYLPFGSDKSVVAFAEHMAIAIKATRGSPLVCLGFFRNGDAISTNAAVKLYPPGLGEREMSVLAEIIDSADKSRPPPSSLEKKQALEATIARAVNLLGSNAEALREFANPNPDPARWCDSFLAIYQGASELPPRQARAAVMALNE